MKRRLIAWLAAISLAFLQNASGQGFVNLDFEDATIVPDPSSPFYPYTVYASDAIPGWTVTGSFLGVNDILYNEQTLGSPSVNLFGLNSNYSSPPLDGAYSIDLYGGDGPVTGVSISQTELVPADALSIFFIAQGSVPQVGGTLLVALNGQNISFTPVSVGPTYTMYGGNISAFAGQVEQLAFFAALGYNWEIDDVQFSPSSVPEPSALGFIALGGLFFGLRRSN